MKEKLYWRSLLAAVALPLAVGTLSSILVGDAVLEYAGMNKPPLSPPGWIFPAVWTLLYALMGFASWLVYISEASQPRKKRALGLYALQLAVNFGWPLIFFKAMWYLAAFFWLLLLWLLVIACTVRFYCIRRSAAWMLLPYVLWLSFAAYLNLGVYLLN